MFRIYNKLEKKRCTKLTKENVHARRHRNYKTFCIAVKVYSNYYGKQRQKIEGQNFEL